MTQIMMTAVRHVTSEVGLKNLQATWLLLDRLYHWPYVFQVIDSFAE